MTASRFFVRRDADQHIAAIGRWQKYGVVVVKLAAGLGDVGGAQLWAVGSYHQHWALLQRHAALYRAAHAGTKITVSLVVLFDSLWPWHTLPGRIRRLWAHTQLYRLRTCSQGLLYRMGQHVSSQASSTRGT